MDAQKVPSAINSFVFSFMSIIALDASLLYLYVYMQVYLDLRKKHLTRSELVDRTRDVAHPALPPQGYQLPFATPCNYNSEMFRLLSYVVEETSTLHVQDIIEIPATKKK